MKKSVIVGFSGGKDSTAASLELLKKGYSVKGLHMEVGFEGKKDKIHLLKELAREIGIGLEIVDFREVFDAKVVKYFINSYTAGDTPNPCVLCNRDIKFGLLMDYALEKMGGDYFATGHYADKVEIEGLTFLSEPVEQKKTQIYFLSLIGRNRLDKILFPLKGMSLGDVRKSVEGLPLIGGGRESQDICFLEGVKLEDFLRKHLPLEIMGEGDILNLKGEKIGTHRGAFYFTTGQRRGTGFASDRKLYVVARDMDQNTITLGEEKDLHSSELRLRDVEFWGQLAKGEILKVKIRYMTRAVDARVIETGETYLKVEFMEPVKSVTPGQIGVFYRKDIIIAAGIID